MNNEHLNDFIDRADKLDLPVGQLLKEYETIAQAYAIENNKPDKFDYDIAYITIKDKYKLNITGVKK